MNKLQADFPSFSFFWIYMGIIHPPSDDEGTERTWFERLVLWRKVS